MHYVQLMFNQTEMRPKLSILIALLFTIPLFAETQRYIVRTADAPNRTGLRVLSNAAGAESRRVRTYRNVDAFAADLTAAEVEALRAGGNVVSVEPVVERHALGSVPFQPVTNIGLRYKQQVTAWGHPLVRATDVWTVTRGENVNVAVLDTGIDLTHPDLLPVYAGGFNVYDPTGVPMDDHKHGTHVSGIIAAADNAFGVVGVAPNVKLWAVKVLDDGGKGYDEHVVGGLDWVISKAKEVGGRWVINMSLGSRNESAAERAAIDEAAANGILVVAAAGNRNVDKLDYPGQYPTVLAVGAIDETGKRADFSSYGNGLSIMAPGVSVPSTVIEGVNETADVQFGSQAFEAWGVMGSPYADVKGKLVFCGLGKPEDFPPSVAGQIALVQRGEVQFRDKARNAKDAGAAAIIIYDNDDVVDTNWNMDFKTCRDAVCQYDPGWENYQFILTLGVSKADGEKLKLISDAVDAAFRSEKYVEMTGTSMAAPYVSGIVAMLLSLDPTLTTSDIRWALESKARDIGLPGWDSETGWGIVDALESAKYVAPHRFDLPEEPRKPRVRSVRH